MDSFEQNIKVFYSLAGNLDKRANSPFSKEGIHRVRAIQSESFEDPGHVKTHGRA